MFAPPFFLPDHNPRIRFTYFAAVSERAVASDDRNIPIESTIKPHDKFTQR